MADKSKIEWTDATWNPVRGCTKISPGKSALLRRDVRRVFRGVPGHPYEQGFDLRCVPEKLAEPLRWTRARMIFVNSMSDLFHKDVSDAYVGMVAEVMRVANWHTYQVSTGQPPGATWRDAPHRLSRARPRAASPGGGVSVENRRRRLPRIDHLRNAPAAVRFLSIEPLLEDLKAIDLTGISGHCRRGERNARGRCGKNGSGASGNSAWMPGVLFFFSGSGAVSGRARPVGSSTDKPTTRCPRRVRTR